MQRACGDGGRVLSCDVLLCILRERERQRSRCNGERERRECVSESFY